MRKGVAAFADAPNAPGRVTVWHPYLRAPGGVVQQAVGRAPAQRQLLRPAAAAAGDAGDGLLRRCAPFRSLSARLTVQFALLFAAAMLVVSAALSTFIAGSASREVESQLQSSGAVYDRLWQQRAHELQNAAQLLARDFGFRAAVATGDQATMQSALGNAAAAAQGAQRLHRHRRRQGLRDRSARSATARPRRLWEPLDAGRLTGVAVLAGRPRQLVAAPIMAPTLIGWVVFAADLDQREMRGLERLSAIPLHAAVLAQSDGRWSEAAGSMSALSGDAAALAENHVGSGRRVRHARSAARTSIALAKPLPTFSGSRPRGPAARLSASRSAGRRAQAAAGARPS